MDGKITTITRERLKEAADVLQQAFAADPMMQYIFATSESSLEESGQKLFIFSCEVRLLLDWPLYGVVDSSRKLVGVAGLSLPGEAHWPPALQQVYDDFKQTAGPESTRRLEAYSELDDTGRPSEPHFQLGVIGVLPETQGKGYGGLMMAELHRMAESDPTSTGVWLDTETENNVAYYQKRGYQVVAHSKLDDTVDIWGMFRPDMQ
ncbi:MAG TPA: GNAT family N-acetyltransferase [Anaerolineales bacterium]|nr:GNAT family N-acetyltransferase [Anaerolineales bacterium]